LILTYLFQDFPSLSSPQQSPFTFCAVLLFVEALIDLVLLSNLPFHEALDQALPYIRPLRNGNLPAEDLQVLQSLPEYITKSLTVYWSVWIGVAACRFFVYAGLALFIYTGRGEILASSYTSAAALGGLDRLKNRVVFTFAFVEMMFWFWVSAIDNMVYFIRQLIGSADLYYPPRGAPGTLDQAVGGHSRPLSPHWLSISLSTYVLPKSDMFFPLENHETA
jgi:hypothetical protein